MSLERGDILGTRYRIERRLGQGGFGCAYLAYHLRLNVLCVIKELLGEHEADESIRERFRNEARMMASLKHPNIVIVHDLLEPGDIPGLRNFYIVMEYMDGGSLDHLLEQQPGRRLPVDRAVQIAVEICKGLAVAHSRKEDRSEGIMHHGIKPRNEDASEGIVHRDIKPHNVLLSADGKIVKVTDWGIAHLPQSHLTTVVQPGTMIYMSTEQAKSIEQALQWGRPLNELKIDARADLYSVGATLYQMVTGRFYLNFEQIGRGLDAFGQQRALVRAIVEREPEPPSRYNLDIPRELDDIILKALAKDPSRRFQSAIEMIGALERVMAPPARPQAAAAPRGNELIEMSKANQLIDQARKASKELNFTQALQLLEQARAAAPRFARVYSETASLHNQMNRHSEAIHVLEQGVQIDPDDAVLRRDLGIAYHKLGREQEALKNLERSLAIDPNQTGIKGLVNILRKKNG